MSVKSSRSTFNILRMLAVSDGSLEASTISKSNNLPMTTTLRVLATLEAAGFAQRDRKSGEYQLGKSAHTLAYAFMSQFPIRDLALPYLQRITLETGQTSSLFMRLGWNAVRMAAVLGRTTFIHNTPVGEVRTLLVGAPSLAIFANISDAEAELAIARQTPGDRTREEIASERRQHRSEEYVVKPCLIDAGAVDMAIPLFDRQDRVIASVALECVPQSGEKDLMSRKGPAREIIAALAEASRREMTAEMSHYDHINPDEIDLEPSLTQDAAPAS